MNPGARQRIALVTGANKGIGFEIARGLARAGNHVLLACRDEDRGRAAAAALIEHGASAEFLPCDVRDQSSAERVAAAMARSPGRLDVLVNNAGIGATNLEAQQTIDGVRDIFETNFFGAVALTLALLPLLKRSPAGRIVNVSSTLGSQALVSDQDHAYSRRVYMGYGPSKAALNAFTIQMANLLRETPVKVNAACPGYCATDLTGNTAERTASEGAAIPLWLAMLPADGPTGGFFEEAGVAPW